MAEVPVVEKWVQLEVGNQNPVVELVNVKGTQVVHLRRAVKQQMPEGLTHCMAAELEVFPQQGATKPLDVGEDLPIVNSRQNLLIVKAPPPPQGQYMLVAISLFSSNLV
jgi:hypothetical protein